MLLVSNETFPPIPSINFPMVIESDNFGTLVIVKALSFRIDAAIKGSTAFFAPLTWISP